MSGSTSKARSGIAVLATAALSLAVGGCRHGPGPFVWVDDVSSAGPAAASSDGLYRVARGDVLAVRVWGQDALTTRVRVREDGRISIPFLQDVEAAGITPDDLARRLQARLKAFIVNPSVTVIVEEIGDLRIAVVGEVDRQGLVELLPGAGVLEAIAAAGGVSEYADRDRIFVIRRPQAPEGKAAPARIRFTYEALLRGAGKANSFQLQAGDVVVVE